MVKAMCGVMAMYRKRVKDIIQMLGLDNVVDW